MTGVTQEAASAHVLEIIEHVRARATAGDCFYFIGILCQVPDKFECWNGGMLSLEEAARIAMRQVDATLKTSLLNRVIPPEMRNPALGADYTVFNAAAGPFNFDFITWLVACELRRRHANAPYPLKVAFWYGRDGHSHFLDVPAFRGMLDNVMRPALKFVGAVEDDTALRGYYEPNCLAKPIIDLTQACDLDPRILEPSDEAVSAVKTWLQGTLGYVTITLRETNTWPHRNSNLDAWAKVAFWLKKHGFPVVIVRDTAKAFQDFMVGVTCPRASIDLDFRLALYQGACCNLFVANGPSHLALFSRVPFLIFQPAAEPEGAMYFSDTPSFWRERIGIEQGGQWPWCGPNQRLVWKPDTFENITEAFNELGIER